MFDLEKYAQCLRLQTVKAAGQETIYICPFCTTDRKAYPKLYINPKKGVFICHHCHLEGSVTDLWAMRCGVDTKTAFKQMCDLVPYTELDRRPEEPVIVRDTEKLHAVYTDFLRHLNLNPEHREDLLRRGLPEYELRHFKSLPNEAKTRWNICKMLNKRYGLADVPGFQEKTSRKGNKYWDCIPSGMLIPVINIKGKITGLQIRNQTEPKYTWFSTAGQLKASALVIPGKGTPWIIEGILKTYVTRHFLKVPCIGIPGTNTWGTIPLDVVTGGRIVIAYDMEDNPHTREARDKLVAFLANKGFEPIIAGWNRNLGKGIDDACLSLFKSGITPTPEFFLPGIAA